MQVVKSTVVTSGFILFQCLIVIAVYIDNGICIQGKCVAILIVSRLVKERLVFQIFAAANV